MLRNLLRTFLLCGLLALVGLLNATPVVAAEEGAEPATVPPVELSKEHQDLCRVKVGDSLPEVELPKIGGGNAKLSALYGKGATVVVFWKSTLR